MAQQNNDDNNLESKVASMENDIAGLEFILTTARQSLQSGREKHVALEKKVIALEAERDQALLKIESQESTISDLQRDVSQYKTEYLKIKLQLKTLETAMSEIISPALQAAITEKVEEAVKKNLPVELQASLPLELQTNMTLDLDVSPASSNRTDRSVSPQPSTSGMSDRNPFEAFDSYFY